MRDDLPTGTVTLLFSDIEGSTHLLQQLRDRYIIVLTECRHILRSAFQQWNGYEVDTEGDACFAVFARASDGIAAAVTAQHQLATHPMLSVRDNSASQYSANAMVRDGISSLASGSPIRLIHHMVRRSFPRFCKSK